MCVQIQGEGIEKKKKFSGLAPNIFDAGNQRLRQQTAKAPGEGGIEENLAYPPKLPAHQNQDFGESRHGICRRCFLERFPIVPRPEVFRPGFGPCIVFGFIFGNVRQIDRVSALAKAARIETRLGMGQPQMDCQVDAEIGEKSRPWGDGDEFQAGLTPRCSKNRFS